MGQPELLAEHKRLADRDHRHPEDHVVADLRRLPDAGATAVHHALAHHRENRLSVGEYGVIGPHHERQCRGSGTGNSAGYRGIGKAVPGAGRGLVRGACVGHVDRGAVDEQCARTRGRQQILIRREHMLALGQHGDHHIGGGCGRRSGLGQRHTGLGGGSPRLFGQVEGGHGVPGFGEVDRHR
ncbi:Uncharacterised protein [Mycobacteroides abscessus]|nr:Uncharacterised protein [Mycobacteroides abscessus]CPX15751.1 Uncharacterised protein [Mycobacteroides abscessus]